MISASTLTRKFRPMSLAVALAILGCLWLAGQASAHVYWGSLNLNRVGRANPDGSEVEPNLVTGASEPWGVAVDGTHLYWANETGNSIGRSNLDGSEVEADFIETAEPTALAVAEGHIYWIDPGSRSIGRAKLDGGGVEAEFIANVGAFAGLAANSEFIYWGNPSSSGSIGRAHLDGSDVEEAFITSAGALVPYGVAIDADHVYWANAANNSIGRADLGGGDVEEAFIANAHPAGVAVDANYVYWGKASPPEAIGRANLDGSDIQSNFVPGAEEAFGLATDVAPATLSTQTSPGVPLGGAIHGIADLGGANAPTGTISFDLYGPGAETCAGRPLATSTASVSGNGSYRSASFTPTEVGNYRWKAAYSGDLENNPLSGTCSGKVAVTPAPATTPLTTSYSLHVGRRERYRKAGRAKLTVAVSAAGELVLSGKHVKKVSRHVSGAGAAKLAILPTGAFARSLERHATRAGIRIAFTPTGGVALVKQLRLRLAGRGRSAP